MRRSRGRRSGSSPGSRAPSCSRPSTPRRSSWCSRSGPSTRPASAIGASPGCSAGSAAASRSGGLLLLVPLLDHLPLRAARRPPRARDRWVPAGASPPGPPRHPLAPGGRSPRGFSPTSPTSASPPGNPLAAFSAQDVWHRQLRPAGRDRARDLERALRSRRSWRCRASAGRRPRWPTSSAEVLAVRDIVLCGFMLAAFWLLAESRRRLPGAYTAYAVVGLALPLSLPATGHALMSLPRFMFVLFPALDRARSLGARARSGPRGDVDARRRCWSCAARLFATWSWAP